jgi:hypothetical protein
VEPKALARATSEVHRAGLAALLKGKSESEILALGTECETARRERDREFRERRSLQPDASAETGSEAGPDGSDGTGDADPNETSATPADLDKLSTVLSEELGEEAARLVTETLASLKAENGELRGQLNAVEQERQLAPKREAANKVLDGLVQRHPDLSNPESRAAVLAKAEGLPALNKDKYDAIPQGPERLAAILEDAALLHFGPGAGTSAKRKVADPPASTSIETPDALPTSQKQAIDIGFEKAWKKARMRG